MLIRSYEMHKTDAMNLRSKFGHLKPTEML